MSKKEVKIIERLRSDEEYYGDLGRQYISNSDIQTLIEDPEQYGNKLEDNENFAKGRYMHQLILEPAKAKDFLIADVVRRDAKYKKFCEENNVSFALKRSEADEIKEIVDWFMDENNPKTMAIQEWITNFDAQYETPMIKKMHGLNFKGKADIITRDKDNSPVIIDIKSSRDVRKFMRNAPFYYYDSQAYIYQELFSMPMIFVVIGKEKKYSVRTKKNYYDVGVFTCSDQFIESGKAKVEKAVTEYNRLHGDNPTEDIESLIITGVL